MSPRTDKTVVLVVVKFCESFLPFLEIIDVKSESPILHVMINGTCTVI